MTTPDTTDYSILDRPEILSVLFHPRKDTQQTPSSPSIQQLMIPVADGVEIGASAHMKKESGPTILFFHGNGEIASDYDELGPIYNKIGVNFIVADYRGYGRSSGHPTVASMMADCHAVFNFITDWLKKHQYGGPLIIMGRSLGSASALEIAKHHQETISGLIVESGFAYVLPLLRLLGADPQRIGIQEENGFDNVKKIEGVKRPTLIIHAEFDHIIPYSDGEALYAACAADKKHLLKIPAANHNDIFMHGLSLYLETIKTLVGEIDGQ